MNNYTFDNFTRINKTAARKLYEAGESLHVPRKASPRKTLASRGVNHSGSLKSVKIF